MFHSEKVLAPRLADLRALAPIGARGFILSRIDHSPLSRLVSLSYPESKEEGKEEEKEEAKDGGREETIICQRNEEGKKSDGGEVTQFLGHLMSVALEP